MISRQSLAIILLTPLLHQYVALVTRASWNTLSLIPERFIPEIPMLIQFFGGIFLTFIMMVLALIGLIFILYFLGKLFCYSFNIPIENN